MPVPLTSDRDADIAHDVPRFEDAPERKMHRVQRANPFQCQLEHFADVIVGQARPRVPLVESVVGIFTIEALVTSAEEGRPVDVKLPDAVKEEWDHKRRADQIT